MKISKHFTLDECLKSETAARLGIKNEPDDEQLRNIKALMCCCMDKVRDLFGVPIIPSSVFRSPKLNAKIPGSSKTSQHLKGQACDFVIAGVSVKDAIEKIQQAGIEYDQIIDEYGSWIHISFVVGKNRMQRLEYRKVKGRTVYRFI